MRYPKRHSTNGRVKVKTIQLFLGKYNGIIKIRITDYRITVF